MRDPLPDEAPPSLPEVTRRSALGLLATVAAAPLLAADAHAAASDQIRPNGGLRSRERPRYGHAVVGLPNGSVILIGGYGVAPAVRATVPTAPTASVQLYHPRGLWFDLAPLRVPRARLAAVLLDDGRIAAIGGFYDAPLDSIEVYDPRANVWTPGPPLPFRIADHAALLCGDRIALAGPDGRPVTFVSAP